MKKGKIAALFFLIAIISVFSVILFDFFANKDISNEFFAMDTFVSSKITGADCEKASDELEALINSLDREVLSRQVAGSGISKLNASGGKVSPRMKEYISGLLSVYESSGGKFDPVLGAVSDLWSFGNSPHLPGDADIKKALSVSGADKIRLDGDILTVESGAVIDFGAAGKGIALDEAKTVLDSMKIRNAVLSVGGSILLYGNKDFTVGIRNPKGNSGSYIMTVSTKAACVSTSGSYEQCFEENGKTYHHILDPDTGYPADNGLVSVTVISQSGIMSDALSTACFVLGTEKGSELAEKYSCEAIFVTDENRVYTTDGIKNSIKITDNGYSFAE